MDFLTCEELAVRYHVTITTVYEWIKGGKLKAKKIGRRYLIPQSAVDEFENSDTCGD